MAEIVIESVRKVYGKVVAVNDVALSIADREFVVLLGPSGCGKTTLLRSIAGLEQIDAGRVLIDGQDVTHLPVRQRRIAMVFQSYAVFPHMSVYENIAFGLRMQRKPEAETRKRALAAAELLHIEDLLERYPSQLSGGQRQRVAVARAIAVPSQVLLMDEPLSNLDALLRLEMRAELKKLLNELNATVVYVTHDQVEALSLGDRIAVMKAGEILQCDTPLRVYDRPAAHFVGSFIGNPPMNFILARVAQNGRALQVSGLLLNLPEAQSAALEKIADEKVWLGLRAENILPLSAPAEGALPGEVLVVEPLGSHLLLTIKIGDEQLKVNAHADSEYRPGQRIWLQLASDKIRLYDRATEQLLA